MREKDIKRIEIQKQTRRFLAFGGKINKVGHKSNRGYRDSMKKTKTYAPGGLM